MSRKNLNIVKSSGDSVKYSIKKLRASLRHSGANEHIVDRIIEKISAELYDGISTKEIFNRAFYFLNKEQGAFASRYKLKKAIYELGPSGFPFENFISAVLRCSGYKTKIGQIVKGSCVDHEIDILAKKNGENTMIECKFHGEEGLNCNVKIPLYIYSRFLDVKAFWDTHENTQLHQGWVVTNTRFTEDAIKYGNCVGLYLLSWDYPPENSLRERIDRLGLYPITVSTLLSKREKEFLVNRKVVLCRQLLEKSFFLSHLGVSDIRQKKIFNEMKRICKISK